MKRTLIIVTLISVLLSLGACASHKNSVHPVEPGQESQLAPDNNATQLEGDFTALASTYGAWTNASIPMKVSINKPTKLSVSGRAYMVRGKSLFISLKFLGMEVATVYLTPDSVYATEKIHRYYVAESLSDVLAGYPLTITDIQDMLIGRAFVAGQGTLSKKLLPMVNLSSDKAGVLTITPKKCDKGISYQINVNNSTKAVASIEVTPGKQQPVKCVYSNPTKTPYGSLSQRAAIKADVNGKSIDTSIDWDFKEAKWNVKDLREWTAPRGYTRLGRSQIINILTSF